MSIAIRAFRRKWLGEAIASVLAQTYRNLEVVVYDDAGDLRSVVEEFDDRRIRYHAAVRRLGPGGGYAAAVALCRGRYVGLLDDDDRYEPHFVERLVAILDGDASIGIASCRAGLVGAATPTPDRAGVWPSDPSETARRLILGRCSTRTSVMLLRRTALDQVDRRRPVPDDAAPDLFYSIQLSIDGWRMVRVDEVLTRCRTHDDQLSRSAAPTLDRGILTLAALETRDPQTAAARDRQRARILLARALHHLRSGDRARARDDIRAAQVMSSGSWRMPRRVIQAAAWSGAFGSWLARRRRP